MTLEEDLLALVRAGDADGCIARLDGLSEAERAKAATRMFATFDAAHAKSFSRDERKKAALVLAEGVEARAALEAARVAMLGTTNKIEGLRKYGWRSVPTKRLALAVLRDRRPAWLPAWCDLVCEATRFHWIIVRELVKEGLCPTPTTDGYVLGMIHTASSRGRPWMHDEQGPPLLETDTELFERDMWRIFEVEGDRNTSLTGCEPFWSKSLLEFTADGRMDRQRVLDGTLSALARDFPQHKAGFYSRLHEKLAPSIDEMAARAPRYIELLTSRISPTVAFATRALAKLEQGDARAIDVAALVDVAASTRTARGRGAALTVVKLLAKVSGKEKERATLAAVSFLEHEAADVVDAVMTLLEGVKAPSRAVLEAVQGSVAAVAASRRGRLSAWLAANGGADAKPNAKPKPNAKAKAKAKAKRPRLPAAHVARARIRALEKSSPDLAWPRVALDDPKDPAPRLDKTRAITPIARHDELLDAVVRAIEVPEDRVTVERVLDGMSRMGVPLDALPAARVKTLVKRTAALSRRSPDGFAGFVGAWLAGEHAVPAPRWGDEKPRTDASAIAKRRLDNLLARLAKGETRALLSAPSTEGFFVDPRALVERALAMGNEPVDIEDAVIALLRLAPDGRDKALERARALRGPLAGPLRHALGGEVRDMKGDEALWIAAARARAPGGDDPRVMKAFPRLGPDAGEAARFTFEWTKEKSRYTGFYVDFEARVAPAMPKKKPPTTHFSVLMTSDFRGGDEVDLRETASFMPLDRRSLFAWGATRLRHNMDWSDAVWSNHVVLEFLVDPDVTLDSTGLLLLAVGLNCREARENALATDALIAAISDGRVVGEELGPSMATLWDPLQEGVKYVRRPVAARWAKTLATVARASHLHSEVVRRIVESFFATPPTFVPPDLNALLELWLELCVEASTGVTKPSARAFLGSLKQSGKAKAAATKLARLPATPSALAAEAHALALERRWARAARWTSL
jgi:hypothetical protein